jgi:ubiquitin thioesterase OTU1
MRLRARTAKGQIQIGSNLSPSNSLQDLITDLAAALGVEPGSILLKAGFPPQPLKSNEAPKDILLSSFCKDGDTIIIETKTQKMKETLMDATRRVMDDDNSCLFRSIAYLFYRDPSKHQSLREIVVQGIKENTEKFSEPILGKPIQDYCEWILNLSSWGGAIEMLILSDYFQTCICSVDVATGRLDKFGDGKFQSMAFVLYSGIHYDAIVLAPLQSSKDCLESDQVVFSSHDCLMMEEKVLQLAARLKNEHQFTEMGTMTLKCQDCGIGLRGQKEAQAHALATTHSNFTEFH